VFFRNQKDCQQSQYDKLLKMIGALSRLSSESDIPYLYYRMAEKIFCKAFEAKDLSRSDISIDAVKGNQGIGIKTFRYENGRPMEKIAEFNKDKSFLDKFNSRELVIEIAGLRNQRLNVASRISGIDINDMLYHCVLRKKNMFIVSETPISLIDHNDIELIGKSNYNRIFFKAGEEEYMFDISKSTLYKKFNIRPVHEVCVKIFDEPFEILEKCFKEEFSKAGSSENNTVIETVCLPLYSKKNGKLYVPGKSGLNQWNAKGRNRDCNEVYIPIPVKLRNRYKDFFPDRNSSFMLGLPNGENISVKVCQDGDKALMSNPNLKLGKWLLREVLALEEKELVTYDKLKDIGIDTVEISKYKDSSYEINFKKLGTYETFEDRYLSD